MEQTEGVDIIKAVVAEPVSKLAVITHLSSVFVLRFILQVTVGTFSLQLLGSSPFQPPAEPTGTGKKCETLH